MRRLALAGATAAAVFASGASHAENKLTSAFAEMTGANYSASQGAQRYNGTLRSGVDFGSGRVVSGVSSARVSLINFTPPQMSVGCSGIDYHLGGISWVNWDQFKDLLDSVLLSAQYAVVNMALDWISEKLGSVFKAVMNALQEATKFEADSCRMGKQLVDWAAKNSGISKAEFDEAVCGEQAANDATTGSISEGGNWCVNFQQRGQKVAEAISGFKGRIWAGLTNPDGTVTAKSANPDTDKYPDPNLCIGNCTWTTLAATGFVPLLKNGESTTIAAANSNPNVQNSLAGAAFGELLMSGTGYRMGYGADSQSGIAPDAAAVSKEPGRKAGTLTPSQFIGMFMCGTDYLAASSEDDVVAANKTQADATGNPQLSEAIVNTTKRDIAAVCESLRKTGATGTGSQQVQILTCVTPAVESAYAKAEGDFSGVNETVAASADPTGATFKQFKDTCSGVIKMDVKTWANQQYVKETLLGEGLLNRNLRIMQSIMIKLIRGNQPMSDVEIGWMNSAPTPVYQMLSLGSLFPTQGINIVNSQGIMITVMQAQALLDRQISDAAKNTDAHLPINDGEFEKVAEFLGNSARTSGRINVDVDQQLQRMTAFQAQVRTMQTAVMDSIYGRQLLGNMDFSSDIAQVAPP